MAAKTRIIVHGALGRMGREVMSSMSKEPDMQVMGGVDMAASNKTLTLEDGRSFPIFTSLADMLSKHPADVVVDFSVAEAGIAAARTALRGGVRVVIGTTGFSQAELEEVQQLCKARGVGAVIASNFALGAVVMTHLARISSRFFDHAEIIELHHEKKLDAPSGTALSTAKAMVEGRGKPFEYAKAQKETLAKSRGGETDGIAVHSVRMPGLLAHQEVIFGCAGQTLTIRHDTINRECYMPGIAVAIREVMKRTDLTIGLDKLLGLS
ncbi:MAG: 4-hydroxy-tetrahydrodipicolinate reductase [Dehalococcoidia bacterium]|nr:4-hydroxy-tetrahydrodipicolinate reductase [Dehalococcoidia bacterium]